ncbi:MAG: hypothetical protein IPP97_01330 [Candidatus Obscuribacter sp.]|jgi:hypothetical protein|nr:hypothetical protein [Candidatus Obscuribacter sp.]MBP6348648.1 hypothetical protein [Candidatus Obscuribacter sp.]MBP6592687.1 hypothetical protein [Candidatus Obscuribacter sp.]MDQ5965343.1 hypothetical protein [Cyanobacteriota bacterium erpe_2018_sw_39hr_WHONDRS-SW48-000098_B_bin.30]
MSRILKSAFLTSSRVYLVAFTYLLLSFCSHHALPAHGQSAADNNTLDKLEQHFFEHNYPKDSTEDRLGRLEKMVFGEAKTGPVQSRITDLQSVVAANQDAIPAGDTVAASSPSTTSNTSTSSQAQKQTQAPAPVSTVAAADSADYPRVDMLEEVILGQEFKQLSIQKRITQLEVKVFGRAGTSDDLSARTDALETHWQKTLSQAQQAKFDQDLSWLESQVIGQTYSQKPLIERIATLEGIVFPNDHPDYHVPIKDQISTLVNAVHLNSQSGHPGASVTPIAASPDSGRAADYGAADYGNYQYTAKNNYASGSGAYPGSYGGTQAYQAAPSQSNYGQGQNYNTASGYPQPAHTYPGQGTQSAVNQYGYANQNEAPASYQSPSAYDATAYQPAAASQSTPTTASEKTNKGHPLLKGLAKALGTAATMAAGAMSNMNFGYGGSPYYGGMGGYNMGYGMPGYGMGFP